MRSSLFLVICLIVGGAIFGAALALNNDYYFFAGYVVLQYVVLATAWNILGGYCGYVNFGSAAFFALGAYSTVAVHKLYPLPIPLLDGGQMIVGFAKAYSFIVPRRRRKTSSTRRSASAPYRIG